MGWSLTANSKSSPWFDLKYDLFGFIPIDLSYFTKVKVRPAVIDDKRVIVALYNEKQFLFGYHYKNLPPGDKWKKRIGSYRIHNPDELTRALEIEQGKLEMVGDKLFFKYKLPWLISLDLQLPINPLNDDMAIIPGLGTALNETVKVVQEDNKEYLEYSGYLLEKVTKQQTLDFDLF